jgi:hypothetical protein
MNDESMPPPPPELARLYRAEARFPDEPAERRDKVRAALLVALATSAPAASASTTATGKLGVSSASLWFGAGGLAIGLVAGASIAWPLALSTSSAPPPSVTPPVELPREHAELHADRSILPPEDEPRAPEPAERLEPAPPVERIATPPAHVDPASAETPAVESRGGRLRAERTILDAARAAIDDRDPARALAALDRHRALEAPRSLDEEAEALRILALALAGRTSEANAARERFRTRFEGSVFTPAIDRATAGSP